MRRWECAGDVSAKFWEAAAADNTVTVRYGRVGSEGRTQPKVLDSAEAAQRYLAKAIAEKERKGYREVTAGAEPGGAAEQSRAEDGQVAFPDEETFEMPVAWQQLVYPRRGGIERSVSGLYVEAGELVESQLKESAHWVEQALSVPRNDPRIVEAARAHLNGSHNPLGAAALAMVTRDMLLPDATMDLPPRGYVVDAWVRSHGMAFAARAVVEHCDLQTHWGQCVSLQQDPWLGFPSTTDDMDGYWDRPDFADRLRSLLSVADEETYRQTVAALADCRVGARRRIVVSYLVPGEQEWVAECCPDALSVGERLRAMLLCSLGSPEQLDHFGSKPGLGWDGWSMPLIATLAESTGKAFTPLMEEALDYDSGTDMIKAFAGALVELPTDDAFRILLAHVENKHVRSNLLEAMRRYPLRALRLLGAASRGSAKSASTAEQLLAAHVRSHRKPAAAALSDLPAEVAALVEPLLTRRDQVAEAPVEALPALLVNPPWAGRRTVRKPRVAAEQPEVWDPHVAWEPREQEAWAAVTSVYWSPSYDWAKGIETLRQKPFRDVGDLQLFVAGPEEVVRPLLEDFHLGVYQDGEAALKPVAAKYGPDALPLLLDAARKDPTTLGKLLLPYLGSLVAEQVCDWLVGLKPGGATARAWLTRHGLETVPDIVPYAVGPVGTERRGAEQALRLLASAHGGEGVVQAAAECGQEAADIVEELLSADPLESTLPARMPGIAAWADPAVLPQILLDAGGALPADAVRNVVTILAVSKPEEVYPGLEVVTAHCTAASLAAFAWALFEQWRLAGMPAKSSWALHALGWLGDDETVRRLTPVLRAWPGEGAHQRAVEGLNALATIGTDVALLHLHGIAQRVPFKALKARAQEKIAEVAEGLGLTGEQLGDRLVPDFGLDADGSTVIDYGPRRFTVGFDEQLRPYVLDADGRHRKDLPAPGAKDDPELAPAEHKRYAALKKGVRTVAADQVRRLEAAMVAQRSWTAGEFRELFVAHPLMRHLVRRLVWLREADGEVTAFRVAEDRTFADVDDAEPALPQDAGVRLAHPLHLGEELDAWSQLFAGYEILQPFPQLGRPVHALTEQEAAGHRLTRFEGVTLPVGTVLGLTKRGWERGQPQDAGWVSSFHRRIGEDRYLVINLAPGIPINFVDEFPEQTFRVVWLDTGPGDYWEGRVCPLRFGDLDPVIASDLLADLTEVTAK
ncbi:hypothetical protein GCM10010211_10120 [Streptomyces albospinus]|uniref:WGR domain-containing protein n=1 Tax=Streptomyces albospinus TaxID=285515 RepID=A0ABQ2URM9_9ACTN|nr:DUF4132 domain-containing protein [Streptomyces albospinus]GGU47939.1 hypothetical protein GCM10010211_10120 [Streptomyces albospinus]